MGTLFLHIGEQPEQTAFGLTRLTVVFDEVEVKDDSDDSGVGELHFAFWVHGEQPQHYNADIGSDENRAVGAGVTIPNPPQYVTVATFGCEDDGDPTGHANVYNYYGLKCESSMNKKHGTNPPDQAAGSRLLVTGTGDGVTELGVTPFTVSDDLWFRVHGRYWMNTEQ